MYVHTHANSVLVSGTGSAVSNKVFSIRGKQTQFGGYDLPGPVEGAVVKGEDSVSMLKTIE